MHNLTQTYVLIAGGLVFTAISCLLWHHDKPRRMLSGTYIVIYGGGTVLIIARTVLDYLGL